MFSHKEEFKQAFQENLIRKLGKPLEEVSKVDVYYVLSLMIREHIGKDWASTNHAYKNRQEKQVYYFSLEFLIGRLLGSNLLNLGILELVRDGLGELGYDLEEIEDQEADAGLGNGGLGRLAACFLDSLASQQYAGHGCGIRYKYGLFEQRIIDGNQVELPDNWLQKGNEWEIRRPDKGVEVRYWGKVQTREENGRLVFKTVQYEAVRAIPYDIPVIGYGHSHVNTLRIWSAESMVDELKAQPLSSQSSYYRYLDYKRSVESISEFLYPDDSYYEGKLLRLKQQYFLCSAGVQSVLRTYSKLGLPFDQLADKVAIQINDTHPTLVIPELMRLLIDEHGYGWDDAWSITRGVVAYTNHTILGEALEKWPVAMLRELLPRIYMIIEELDRRFRIELSERFKEQPERISELTIIEHDQIRMAHLAIVGSHSVNGVASLHTEILKTREMKSFFELFPERFNNKTNGVTHRRWLMHANPQLSSLITDAIGDNWIKRPRQLKNLISYSEDAAFQDAFRAVKQKNKEHLAKFIFEKKGIKVNPDSIFDVQVKRLHAYKRQLLNILHIMHLYNQLKQDSTKDLVPRTFIFAAKAAPAYYLAKRIIKLIHTVAERVNQDPEIRDIIKIVFLENYSVSLAEQIIPASEVSEQISTASKEASGTGNMKFMMNGALTIGTLDGANIEIHEQLGNDEMFLFGLTAEQVQNIYQHGGYTAWDLYYKEPHIKEVMDQLIYPGPFCIGQDEFMDIRQSILDHNDEFFVLQDFSSYAQAHMRIDQAYRSTRDWQKKAILNVAHSGYFSSDCTVRYYASDIWGLQPITD